MGRPRLLRRPLGHSRQPSVLVVGLATVAGITAIAIGVDLLVDGTDDRQPEAESNTAMSFAVLAGGTVKNTGLSVVNGDLGGAEPGNAIAGFQPGSSTEPSTPPTRWPSRRKRT